MTLLAGYRVEERIGRGGVGDVWRGRAADGTRVAIKTAQPQILHVTGLRRLFEVELRATARMDHPHIVWLYDHGIATGETPLPEGTPYLVLEHCGGGTLEDHPPTTWAEARAVLLHLLEALAHAHARGLIHRDLKPANVLRPLPTDVRPGWKLADFGIARLAGDDGGPSIAGTPAYMAPEQAAGALSQLGPWTDLFALGAMAWELVSGRPVFDGLGVSQRLRNPDLPTLQPWFPVPAGLPGWLGPLLAPEPDRRPRAAADVAQALRDLGPADWQAPLHVVPETARSVPVLPRDWREDEHTGPRLALQGAGLSLFALRDRKLVGRLDARERLWRSLREAVAHQTPRLLQVAGPRRSGRTALLRWVCRRSNEMGAARTAHVTGRPGASPTAPLRELWSQLLRLADVPGDHRARVLATRLASLGVADTTISALLQLEQVESDAWGSARPVHDTLRTLATDRPLVLAFDDVEHFPTGARLLLQLQSEGGIGVLGLATVDPELPTDHETARLVTRLPGAAELRLGPLSPAEQDELVSQIGGLDLAARGTIVKRAGALPGDITALLTHWVREGLLEPTPAGFAVVGDPDALPSQPGRWSERLLEALAPLTDEARKALERAAVLGQDVDEDLWGRCCDDPSAELAGMGRAPIRAAALRERIAAVDHLLATGIATETDEGFAFAHREVVETLRRRAMLAGRLTQHHLACAAQLALVSGADATLRRGRHLATAGRHAEAVPLLLVGTRRSTSMGDQRTLPATLTLIEHCLDELGDQARLTDRAALHVLRAETLHEAGRLADALTEAAAGLRLARAARDDAALGKAHQRMADIRAIGGQWAEAEPHLLALLEVGQGITRPAVMGLAKARLAWCAKVRGDHAAAQGWSEQASQELRAATTGPDTDHRDLASVTEHMSRFGTPEAAARAAQRSIEACDRTGDLRGLLFGWSKLLEARRDQGRHDEAIEAGRQALKIAELRGDVRVATLLRVNLGNELRIIERLEPSLAMLRDAARTLPGGQAPALEVAVHASLVRVCSLLGLWEELDHHLVRTATLARSIPTDPQLTEELEAAAVACTEAGDPMRARQIRRVYGAD